MTKRQFDTPEDLPGQEPVTWRRSPQATVLAALAGAAWPPLILTLLIWPPMNWKPGLEMDWRLTVLAIGVFAVPAGLWAVARERRRTRRPGTRLGIVWRFMFYGGLLAAGLQGLMAITGMVLGWFEAGDFAQAMGATETSLLLFGVMGLPIAALVGVSYALWAGLCAAYIAFIPRPRVKDRLGLLAETRDPEPS